MVKLLPGEICARPEKRCFTVVKSEFIQAKSHLFSQQSFISGVDSMALLTDRVECKELLDKLVDVQDAVKHVTDRSKIGISGFTKSGEPKVFMPALAKHFAQKAPNAKIGLFSGASLSEEVENPLAP